MLEAKKEKDKEKDKDKTKEKVKETNVGSQKRALGLSLVLHHHPSPPVVLCLLSFNTIVFHALNLHHNNLDP